MESAMNIQKSTVLAPESTGLVIVEMQVEGCDRHGDGVKPVIRNIASLLGRFREVGGKVIHIQSVRPKGHPEFTVFGKDYSLLENSPRVELLAQGYPAEEFENEVSRHCDDDSCAIVDVHGAHEITLLPLELETAVVALDMHGKKPSKQRSLGASGTLQAHPAEHDTYRTA